MSNSIVLKSNKVNVQFGFLVLFAAFIALVPQFVLAVGGPGDLSDTCESVNSFFSNIETILNVASVAVVTIAVIIAGYQIAFAHKRISDVAPILIGALIIGAAAQIAGWLVNSSATCS